MRESQENIVALSDIREKKLRVLSPSGIEKVVLTTLPDPGIVKASQLARLSELLNCLESEVERLNYKSFEAYATLSIATENLRAAVYDIVTDSDFTDE
jgi:hypothetical protein